MSLLSKKPKSGRLSRFLSEFQQSPKHRRSLVVQTGFPASLIDLFVKNRDRLKKSSSKTKTKRIQRQIQTAPTAFLPIKTPDACLEKPIARKPIQSKPTSDKNGSVCSGGSGALVLMAFKIFIVAVLALSTQKKLTVGVSLSAFVLLLTELVAARVVTSFRRYNTDTQRETPLASVHEENVVSCEKIVDSKDETEHNSSSKGVRIRELLLKDEKSKSKSSKLKSKIMKKLRSFSKKNKKTIVVKEEETLSDVSSLVSADITESERDEEKSNPPLIESKGDNMNGIVVIVIVLTGLLSGKIVAIGLTLSCLYLRFGTAKKSSF